MSSPLAHALSTWSTAAWVLHSTVSRQTSVTCEPPHVLGYSSVRIREHLGIVARGSFFGTCSRVPGLSCVFSRLLCLAHRGNQCLLLRLHFGDSIRSILLRHPSACRRGATYMPLFVATTGALAFLLASHCPRSSCTECEAAGGRPPCHYCAKSRDERLMFSPYIHTCGKCTQEPTVSYGGDVSVAHVMSTPSHSCWTGCIVVRFAVFLPRGDVLDSRCGSPQRPSASESLT